MPVGSLFLPVEGKEVLKDFPYEMCYYYIISFSLYWDTGRPAADGVRGGAMEKGIIDYGR